VVIIATAASPNTAVIIVVQIVGQKSGCPCASWQAGGSGLQGSHRCISTHSIVIVPERLGSSSRMPHVRFLFAADTTNIQS